MSGRTSAITFCSQTTCCRTKGGKFEKLFISHRVEFKKSAETVFAIAYRVRIDQTWGHPYAVTEAKMFFVLDRSRITYHGVPSTAKRLRRDELIDGLISRALEVVDIFLDEHHLGQHSYIVLAPTHATLSSNWPSFAKEPVKKSEISHSSSGPFKYQEPSLRA
jgi:hypothetical protein